MKLIIVIILFLGSLAVPILVSILVKRMERRGAAKIREDFYSNYQKDNEKEKYEEECDGWRD